MKKGRISNEDKQYVIDNINSPVAKLAKKIERSEDIVLKIIEESGITPQKEITKDVVDFHPIKDAYGRSRNAIVLTPAVSQQSDTVKRRKTDPSCIFQINSQKKS